MNIDHPRGKKRSATTASQDVGAEDVGNIDPTPRKGTTPAKHPKLKVFIQSPPESRPSQCRRVGEDHTATVAPVSSVSPVAPDPTECSEPADPVEPMVPASEELWVARGKVSVIENTSPFTHSRSVQDRCAQCIHGSLKVCELQWFATKPAKACQFCAHQKKTCDPTDEFVRRVKEMARLRRGTSATHSSMCSDFCGSSFFSCLTGSTSRGG